MEVQYIVLTGIWSGLIASLIASFIFWYFISQKQPRIKIASNITVNSVQNRRAKSRYSVKIENADSHNDAINLDIRAYLVHKESSIARRYIPVEPSSLLILNAGGELAVALNFNEKGFLDTLLKDLGANHSLSINKTKAVDLNTILDEYKSIRLLVKARHPSSNFSKVFRKEFTKEMIVS
jgi:hypothetical protein